MFKIDNLSMMLNITHEKLINSSTVNYILNIKNPVVIVVTFAIVSKMLLESGKLWKSVVLLKEKPKINNSK